MWHTTQQPRVRAYDLGDNMLSSSESAVLVSVLINPTSATLRPTDRVFEVSASIMCQVAPPPSSFRTKQGRTIQLFTGETTVRATRGAGGSVRNTLTAARVWTTEIIALRGVESITLDDSPNITFTTLLSCPSTQKYAECTFFSSKLEVQRVPG